MSQQNPKFMSNQIPTLANGQPNPAFGAQIRNVLLVQVGGWSGLPTSTDHDPDYPLNGGRTAYLTKNPSVYAKQAEQIAGLGPTVAISFLLMNDADSTASGYGACWEGSWVNGQNCDAGSWRKPLTLYLDAKAAANAKGIPVAPEFSIMNYQYGLGNGAPYFLPRLKDFLAWARPTFDKGSLRNGNGQYVVIIDGLQDWTPLNDTQRLEIMTYMASQTDILWVDNMVGSLSNGQRSTMAANILTTSWGSDSAKSSLAQLWGENYVYTFTTLQGASPTHAAAMGNKVSQNVLEKWMNINPYSPTQYPIFIHQWNEYAEYLIFEPSQRAGQTNYEYLKWMISRQLPMIPSAVSPPNNNSTTDNNSSTNNPVDNSTPVVTSTISQINISALTAQHDSCKLNTLGTTACMAAANRYCVAQQSAGGFAFASTSGVTAVCLKSPNSRGVNTSFTLLRKQHDSCASSANSDSPACLAATHRYCISQGYQGGLGIMEYNGDAAIVLCSQKLRPTIVNLTELAPECTTANARNRECATASDKACRTRGFKAGYGLIEYSSTEAVLNCVE